MMSVISSLSPEEVIGKFVSFELMIKGSKKIIEQGTHLELIAKKGAYYNLYTRQFQEEAVEGAFGHA